MEPHAKPGSAARRRRKAPGAVRFVPMPRDARIVIDVAQHGVEDGLQIQEGHFGSVPRRNARIAQMVGAGYLVRHAGLPRGNVPGHDSQSALYTIGPAAVSIVADTLGVDPGEVRKRLRTELPLSYVAHRLKAKDFHLAVLRTVEQAGSGWSVESWRPEPAHTYEYRSESGGQFQTEVFKPDAALVLTVKGETEAARLVLYVEIDMGTVSRARWMHKAAIAERFMGSALARKHYGDGASRLLVACPSVARCEYLRSLAAEEGRSRLWFATFADIEGRNDATGLLAPIWRVAGRATLASLGELVGGAAPAGQEGGA